MNKFLYIVLAIISICIIFIISNINSSHGQAEIINLTNIEQVEILNSVTNTPAIVKNNKDIEEISFLINQLNSGESDGSYNGENEVLYQIYIHNKDYIQVHL
jgi:uncharacterized membrane protein affecting hemolysin expression